MPRTAGDQTAAESLAAQVRIRRMALGMSQERLADLADVSRGTVRNLETGTTEPNRASRAAVLAALAGAESREVAAPGPPSSKTTGPDLYREALRVRQYARERLRFPSPEYSQAMAEAQMLMTGALAAATALLGPVAATGYDDEDLLKWHEVAGVNGGAEAGEEQDVPACRLCGCTENAACEGGCHWVPDPLMLGDLCSACRDAALAIARAVVSTPPSPVAAELVELPVDLARELACLNNGDTSDGWTVVAVEDLGHGRWESHHRLIIRSEAGEHFAGVYSKGLTEYQDTRPWEAQAAARFDPVVPRTRMVEVIEYGPPDGYVVEAEIVDQVRQETGGETSGNRS